ncbi:DUF1481 domain-containing protein [Vibrio sp. T187]|uniref:DUF1481 domain-containing protein n=1 Tax=Vibrio TaxID=662 RepID=UPI0010C9C17F|nr:MULTISPECIES: DUF1481 domain-containing protein [Vibrio]MBW3697281.1 DUF1481 domain-containing protein [Vibrio sp. T187]
MNKAFLIVPLLSSLIIGCSSSNPRSNLDQFVESSGGQVMGDATSFYWVTNKLTTPDTASDYVTVGDYGWYKSEYRWQDGNLREFVRQGEQRNSVNDLVPYRIHVRFNKENEAIYQQYRIDNRVLPIQAEQLQRYQKEANSVLERTQEQKSDGLELIQGYWDGSTFETCSGKEYEDLEFNQTLPSFVINRLASVDSYAAFLGSQSLGKVSVEELLMLAEDSQDCIERTALLEE